MYETLHGFKKQMRGRKKKTNERWFIKLISNGALFFFLVAVVWTPNFIYINYALFLPIKLISRGHILSDYFLYFKLFVVIVFSYGVLKLLGRVCRLFGSYNVQGINLRSCARRIPNLHQQQKKIVSEIILLNCSF